MFIDNGLQAKGREESVGCAFWFICEHSISVGRDTLAHFSAYHYGYHFYKLVPSGSGSQFDVSIFLDLGKSKVCKVFTKWEQKEG